MKTAREFLGILGLIFDIAAFAAVAGAILGVFIFMAKTVANMAPG